MKRNNRLTMKKVMISEEQIQTLVESCFKSLNVECKENNETSESNKATEIDARLMELEDLTKLWNALSDGDEIVIIK